MTTDNRFDRLEQLNRLREAGALTQDEFDAEKQRLLHPEPEPVADAPLAVASEEPLEEPAPRRRMPWLGLGVAAVALVTLGGWGLAEWTRDGVPSATEQPETAAAEATEEEPEPTAEPEATIESLPSDRQLELAYAAVFGSDTTRTLRTDDTSFSYSGGRVLWTRFGPVLVVEGTGEAQRTALGTLGLFYLREVPGPAFETVRQWPDAIPGSVMGNPPEWKARNDLSGTTVIEATGGGVWQGYACDSTSLTELTPTGPVTLVTFESGYNSTGALGDEGESYTGKIGSIVRGRSFEVQFSGTRDFTNRYVRQGNRYTRQPVTDGTDGDIPTC